MLGFDFCLVVTSPMNTRSFTHYYDSKIVISKVLFCHPSGGEISIIGGGDIYPCIHVHRL